jgi:hypothetical protein
MTRPSYTQFKKIAETRIVITRQLAFFDVGFSKIVILIASDLKVPLLISSRHPNSLLPHDDYSFLPNP